MFNSKHSTFLTPLIVLISIVFFGTGSAFGQDVKDIIKETVNKLEWRNIGPANMGGRIDDFAVDENDPHIIYVGTASGGVWKTTNNGVTWKPIFDDQLMSTIGDVTVAPSNPEIVWVGTGEANNRQSSSWGNGVYKSTDGGKTWHHKGLDNTHHIGRLAIDHQDPDIVYVAAAGHLWGPNEERGLYKTVNGGVSWTKVLSVDENTGCIDVAMDPENNNILYAAMYQRRRRSWGFIGSGPGSGLYKTVDGGVTWKKLTNGLPKGDMGRIGVNVFRKDPNIVYATIESKQGGTYRSEDKGETWTKMSDTNPRPMYYSKIRVDPNNDQRIWVLGASMYTSYDGGKTFNTRVVRSIHGDHHAMWINPKNSNHMILGSDGGIYFSYDRGLTWDFVWTIPLGQFYEVGFDMQKPYNIYGGLQDNGSWGGPSATKNSVGITNGDWFRVGGGDGFYTQVDPNDPNILYYESQNGSLSRLNLYTKESKSIRPTPEDPKERYRFNWNSPILISPHNSRTIYYGGNKLFKSANMGDDWTAGIDLTKHIDRSKMPLMGMLPDTNHLSLHDGISNFGNIITISESPLKEGVLWVGTDDGNVQVSTDGGGTWSNAAEKLKNVPEYTYVSRVVASNFVEGRAYVTLDGHRNDDFKPYIFVTENFGKKWKSIASNLPEGGTVNVIREHHRNENLLFAGTERGAYFTIDRGETWHKFENLPIVPVDDIAIHPRENDLIFGTHGRSIYVLDDITPLEELSEKVLQSDFFLFSPRTAERFSYYNNFGATGHKMFIAPNPTFGAIITYFLKEELGNRDRLSIEILDEAGKTVRRIRGTKNKGFNRTPWDLRYQSSIAQRQGAGTSTLRRFRSRGPLVVPGEYTVRLTVKGQSIEKTVRVDLDPRIKVSQADLIAQRDALLRLDGLSGEVSRITNRLRAISSQMDELEKYLQTSGNLKNEIKKEFDALKEKISEFQIKITGSRQRREVVAFSREISTIARSIGGITEAPSAKDLQKIEELPAKLDKIKEEYETVIKGEIAEFNKMLSEKNIPFINTEGGRAGTPGRFRRQ
ncbi:hypothetical protein ACFL4T_07090 [candidate division KSB1 bacterium]